MFVLDSAASAITIIAAPLLLETLNNSLRFTLKVTLIFKPNVK